MKLVVNKTNFHLKVSRTNIFSTMIDDEDMNNKLVQQIDIQGDCMKHKSNVKAQMTEWEMWNKPGFNTFTHYYINVAHHIATRDYKFKCELKHIKLSCLWGMKYLSNDYAIEHDHWPATFGCVYYINPPKDCPGLYFKELDYTVVPKHGELTIFDAALRHEVPKKSFIGNRYTVSGNITIDG